MPTPRRQTQSRCAGASQIHHLIGLWFGGLLLTLVGFVNTAQAQTILFEADAEEEMVTPPWGGTSTTNCTIESVDTLAHSGNRSYKHDCAATNPPTQHQGPSNQAKVRTFAAANHHRSAQDPPTAYYSVWFYIERGFMASHRPYQFENDFQFKTVQSRLDGTTVKGGPKIGSSFKIRNGILQYNLSIADCELSMSDVQSVGSGTTFENPGSPCHFWQRNPRPIPRQKWFHLEFYLKAAETNGHVTVWQDGVEIFNIAHPKLDTLTKWGKTERTKRSDNKYLYWIIGQYFKGVASVLYHDDAMITDYRTWPVHWSPGTPDNTAPAAPMRLTVMSP